MTRAIRRYFKDFVAILVLALVGLTTLFVILSQQSAALPSWFPILGEDRFSLSVEMETAQAITPGQGQTVNFAGVKVGDVTGVELEDGVAVVEMEIDYEYAELLHPDASVLLRPRTGLQDMTVEIDPGTAEGTVEEGSRIELAASKPNVNVDEIIASLDGDTRAFLKLLLAGGAEAFSGDRDREFSQVLRRIEPTTRDIAKINGAVAKRRANLRRVITNFGKLAETLGSQNTQLARFVRSQNAVFGAFAEQDQAIQASLRALPGALQETRTALDSSEQLSRALIPALDGLTPQAEALGPALEASTPFFEETFSPLRDQIRPFTRQVDKPVRTLKKAAGPLADSAEGLSGGFSELNNLLNALAYNPPGGDEGYLFYLSWLGHNTNSDFLLQNGAGPLRRGLVQLSCQTSQLADGVTAQRPVLQTARDLTRIPSTSDVCTTPLP